MISFFTLLQMGYDVDTLKIISMNFTKAGKKPKSYLRELLDGQQPDLCLLPGDNDELKKTVVCEYEQCLTQGNNKTVLLYKAKKVKLTATTIGCNEFPQLPGINFDSMVCPQATVEVGPYQEPKRFSILMWDDRLTQERIDRRTQAENIIRLSQTIAEQRGSPILVGGDFNLEYTSIQKIVTHLNTERTNTFMEQATNSGLFPPETYLPSMTKGTLRPQRHLFAMRVFACKQNDSIVAEYGTHQQSDFFIASKELELKDTTLLDFGTATGRQASLENLRRDCVKMETETPVPTYSPTKMSGERTKTETFNYSACYAPTRTEMVIPPRPPKHHGG